MVGTPEGNGEGIKVGTLVGLWKVGSVVGNPVGDSVGMVVGKLAVGIFVGKGVGISDGTRVGISVVGPSAGGNDDILGNIHSTVASSTTELVIIDFIVGDVLFTSLSMQSEISP